MGHFKDDDVSAAHIRLLDAICSWERATSRDFTVVVIPHNADEPIAVSTSGKPHVENGVGEVLRAVGFALQDRARS